MRTKYLFGKKVLAMLLGSCISSAAIGQVQIQTTLPLTGLVQKNQLWNLVVVNSSATALDGRIEMVLTDRLTSQELMTATTAEFRINRGSQALNAGKLAPVQYNYIGSSPDAGFNSLLPAGAYTICYSFVRNPNTDKREMLAEECGSFDVEPLSPPLLNFPADSALLDVSPTQFSWLPPTPAAMLRNLRYEVLFTEVQPSQRPAEAIEENLPLYSGMIPQNNFMTYPAAAPAFEKDRWYAWQVVARDDNAYAGKSEVWVFQVRSPEKKQNEVNTVPYVQLQRNGGEKTIAPDGILRFFYVNQVGDEQVNCTILDMSNRTDEAGKQFSLVLQRGQNYIQKDISRYLQVADGHVYKLLLENSAGEKWYILFETKKTDQHH